MNCSIMKNLTIAGFLLLVLIVASCDNDKEIIQGEFEFITEYSATLTVGGVIGITERTFNIGEVYKGIDNGGETITIRIAEHTELNEDCPDSSCYQESLEVPREFLKFVH